MEILFHLGAHCTDDGLLIRSILRNRARLAEEGIGVPGPGRYKELIGEVSTRLRGNTADDDTEAMLMEAICDDDTADRIILSNENFLCRAHVAFDTDSLYPRAAKAGWLSHCFPNHQTEFAIALRNPASFLPDLVARMDEDDASHVVGTNLNHMVWSDVIDRIAAAAPNSRILVWCHEDTPFIWPEIISEITGHDPFTSLEGQFDMLETIISPQGFTRLTEFLSEREVSNESQRRKAIAAFLEAHAIEDEITATADLPGWTEETVDDLTLLYDDDVERIAQRSDVTFLSP